MAQNLVINGVTYNSVNSLSIPKSAGGNTVFPDTSDANATTGDIALNKTAYVNGSKITGTATGGGGNYQSKSVTYTSNGIAKVTPDAGYDALSEVNVTVDVSGGGNGELSDLILEELSFIWTLKNIDLVNVYFGACWVTFSPECSNLTFTDCAFPGSLLHCSQETYDAIMNGTNNDLTDTDVAII